ncbi:MAG: hypothetical protein O3C59_04835 [Proteobacteria bacterium]|nr:hypothetical protein [Pseudomonadota bacterium]
MPTVTVLAPDSALAMDEVIRQLGDNAYIVATHTRDGQVEILATNEPTQIQPQRKRTTSVSFADAISERLSQGTGTPQVFQSSGSHLTNADHRNVISGQDAQENNVKPIFASQRGTSDIKRVDALAAVATNHELNAPSIIENTTLNKVVPLLLVPDQLITTQDVADANTIDPHQQIEQVRLETSPHQHLTQSPTMADDQPGDGLRPLLHELAAQLSRLESTMTPATQNTEKQRDPFQEFGFSHEVLERFAPNRAEADRISRFVSAMTKSLVAPTPYTSVCSTVVIIVGASGVGKTTLAGKLATVADESRLPHEVVLMTLSEKPSFAKNPLSSCAQMLSVSHAFMHADQLDAMHFLTSNTTHIIDCNLEPEILLPKIAELRDQLGYTAVSVILAVPAGTSVARLRNELDKYKGVEPAIALTKLDECELSAEEASQIAQTGTKIAWLSGTRNLTNTIAPATEEMMTEFLTGLLADGN